MIHRPVSRRTLLVAGVFLLASLFVFDSSQVRGQQLFVKGGSGQFAPVRSVEPPVWTSNYWMGIRAFQANAFHMEVSVGHNEALLLNGEVAVRPWYEEGRLDPYAFLGYGRYYDDERSTLLSTGVGAEVEIGRGMGIFLEVDKKWSSFNTHTAQKTLTGWGTGIGVSYTLNRSNSRTSSSPRPPEDRVETAREHPNSTTGSVSANDTAVARAQAVRGHPARFGETVVDPNKYPEMNFVSDGVFTMGLTDEDPLTVQTAGIKRVSINGLFIDKHEVSNAEYREYLESLSPAEREEMMPDSTVWEQARTREGWTAYFRSEPFEDFPVIGVNWEQANAYCEAHDKRLPTEAEWEYVARAGHTGRIYPWEGHDVQDGDGNYRANHNPGRAGYAADGYAFTAPVDEYPPNDWGFYNMSGNVAEWTEDAYTQTFDEISDFNPVYEDTTEVRRVIRGGSWASDPFYIGVGVRDAQPKDEASPYVGFRCVRNVGRNVEEESVIAEEESTDEESADDSLDATSAAAANNP